jgi:anti-sigma B factor antagonist
MHDWNRGGVMSDVAADPGSVGDQLVRMKTGAVVRAVGRIPSPRQAAGRVLVVTVAGEIDLVTVDKVRTALAAGLDQLEDGEVLVIDLTGVTSLCSTGLQALIEAIQAAQCRHVFVRIVIDRAGPMIRLITVTGLDKDFALFDTVDEALRACRDRRDQRALRSARSGRDCSRSRSGADTSARLRRLARQVDTSRLVTISE